MVARTCIDTSGTGRPFDATNPRSCTSLPCAALRAAVDEGGGRFAHSSSMRSLELRANFSSNSLRK